MVVSVTGDDALELDETFAVQISAPVNATLGNATTSVTITNNDPIPPGSAILNVTGASVREGNRHHPRAHLHDRAVGRNDDRRGR